MTRVFKVSLELEIAGTSPLAGATPGEVLDYVLEQLGLRADVGKAAVEEKR